MGTVQLNNQGAEVRVLQELLNLNGIIVTVDGMFGSKTYDAVVAFQKHHFDENSNPLLVDGIVGPSTWKSLMAYDKRITPGHGTTGDTYTLARIDLLHPKLREEVRKIYSEILQSNLRIRITDTLRSFDEQARLYAQGRTAPGKIVTKARPGQSYHNYGLAVDFALLLPGGNKVSWDMDLDLNNNHKADWLEVVAIFKHYGWTWGGDWSFKDYPHFEKTFGYTTHQLLTLHQCLNNNNAYVNI